MQVMHLEMAVRLSRKRVELKEFRNVQTYNIQTYNIHTIHTHTRETNIHTNTCIQ